MDTEDIFKTEVHLSNVANIISHCAAKGIDGNINLSKPSVDMYLSKYWAQVEKIESRYGDSNI